MKNTKEAKWRNCGFILATIVLLLITTLSIAGTVYSKEADRYRVDDGCIKEQEQEYLQQVKAVLQNYNCNNSGITMTKIIDENGDREYYVKLHHKKINAMDLAEKAELRRDLENVGFSKEKFTIFYEFLP